MLEERAFERLEIIYIAAEAGPPVEAKRKRGAQTPSLRVVLLW